jgi:hypothetical protein
MERGDESIELATRRFQEKYAFLRQLVANLRLAHDNHTILSQNRPILGAKPFEFRVFS